MYKISIAFKEAVLAEEDYMEVLFINTEDFTFQQLKENVSKEDSGATYDTLFGESAYNTDEKIKRLIQWKLDASRDIQNVVELLQDYKAETIQEVVDIIKGNVPEELPSEYEQSILDKYNSDSKGIELQIAALAEQQTQLNNTVSRIEGDDLYKENQSLLLQVTEKDGNISELQKQIIELENNNEKGISLEMTNSNILDAIMVKEFEFLVQDTEKTISSESIINRFKRESVLLFDITLLQLGIFKGFQPSEKSSDSDIATYLFGLVQTERNG